MSRFDKLALQWDLNPVRVKSALKTTRKIKELLDIKDKDILDYGAGTGLVSFDLFEDARFVTAMDSSQGMLDELNRKIKEANITNIKTALHDGDINPLPENSFDIIVTAMTLHHIKKPLDFIKKASRSLRKGGYLVISDLESEDGTFHGCGNDGVEHFGFDKEEIANFYEKAGLKTIYLQTNETISKHKDFYVFLAIGKHV